MNLNLTWSARRRRRDAVSPRRRRRGRMRVYVSPERAAAVSRQCPFHTGDVMYTFPFALPPFYVAIIRCLGVLEGVAIQVDPGFRIASDAAQKTNLNLPGSRRWRRRDALVMIIRESRRLVSVHLFDTGQRRLPVRGGAVVDGRGARAATSPHESPVQGPEAAMAPLRGSVEPSVVVVRV